MCAIFGSFDRIKLKELYDLNSYRGTLSYSIASFKDDKLSVLLKDKGIMHENLLDNIPYQEDSFFIGHTQAPTTESDDIHPAVYGCGLLWHNGIIKQKTISDGIWDTQWLLEQIVDYGWSALSRVDGTFACVMFNNNELFIFRNEISPLFIDDNLNISSTKFDNSKSLSPNKVFKIDLMSKMLSEVASFETLENPYYIPE